MPQVIQKRFVKSLSKAFIADLKKQGYKNVKVDSFDMELRTHRFDLNLTTVYIHEYRESIKVYAVNKAHTKDQTCSTLEVKQTRYMLKRPFGGCAVTILTSKMFQIAVKVLKP